MIRICKRGHKQIKRNIYVRPSGKKQCKLCIKIISERNKIKLKERSREWALSHKDRVKEIQKKYRGTDEFRQKHKLYMRQYFKPYLKQLQIETLTHYGNGRMVCQCCGENEFVFLTIDHINGRTLEEKKNVKYRGWQLKQFLRAHGYPKGYQTLCFNCNSGRALNGGVCPHKQT